MSPIVSIITPSFNRADIIHETAKSIFNQTYPYWEWIVVDDGSTDNSWEILEQFASQDSRVKIFKRNREPKGACTCRNMAVEKCNGDYLLFLDSDDVLASFCLQQRVSVMQLKLDCDFAIFPMLLFKQKLDDLKLLWNIDSPKDDIERILLGDAICQGTGTLWKKSSFVKIGMWNEELLLWQDVELHLRAFLLNVKYKKRLDLKPDVFLRISDISLSRTGYHALPKFLSRMSVLKQIGERIETKHQLSNYKEGLRYMFTDLLISAANSQFTHQITQLMQIQKQWQLFNAKEQNLFRMYAWLQKYRLYKVPFFKDFLVKKLHKRLCYQQVTLNKIKYVDLIKF